MKFILIIALLLPMFSLPESCTHTRDTFYRDLRLLEVRVKNYNKSGIIEYVFEGHGTVVFGTFQVTQSTFVGEPIKVGKIYLAVYCSNGSHGTGANRRNKNLTFIETSARPKAEEVIKQSDPLTQ